MATSFSPKKLDPYLLNNSDSIFFLSCLYLLETILEFNKKLINENYS